VTAPPLTAPPPRRPPLPTAPPAQPPRLSFVITVFWPTRGPHPH